MLNTGRYVLLSVLTILATVSAHLLKNFDFLIRGLFLRRPRRAKLRLAHYRGSLSLNARSPRSRTCGRKVAASWMLLDNSELY